MQTQTQFRSGFTLIELLVVISIIVLLLSILLPSLTRARATAQAVVCLSNMRRLAVSMQIYLDSNRDMFPPDRLRWDPKLPPGDQPYIMVGKYKRYRPRWIWYLNEGMGYVINPYAYETEEDFNQALEMDNDYFICPSVKGEKYMRNIRNGAYGFNYQYLANTRPFQGTYANYPNTFSNIKKPSQTIVFGDSRGCNIPHGEHAYLFDPPKMAVSKGARHFSPKHPTLGPLKYSPADARHNQRACIAFLDSHAEKMTYEQIGYELDPVTGRPIEKALTQLGGPGDNRLWTGTATDEPHL